MTATTFLFALFTIFSLIHLASQALGLQMLITVTKPLLMPALAVWLYLETGTYRYLLAWAFVALGFSTLGDILLMGAGHATQGVTFFLAGVGAFLLAQLAYIRQFIALSRSGMQTFLRPSRTGLLLMLYLVGMLFLLAPRLDGLLRGAVIVYALVLSGMVLAAFQLWRRNEEHALQIGAVLFLLSDSLLALNRFHAPIPLSGVWIMSTYLCGQYLIAKGLRDVVRCRPA